MGEMEDFANDDGETSKPVVIEDCGELKEGENWNYCDDDGTLDALPPFPADWCKFDYKFSTNEMLDVLKVIKEAGNYFYRSGDFVKSARKYRKLTRYYNFFKDQTTDESDKKLLDTFQLVNLTNLAATELKLGDFKDVIFTCNAVIKLDQDNSKAFYRRGIANLELKNYELAIDDLKMAHNLVPGNRAILKEFDRAKKYLLDYRAIEKVKYSKMFQ